MPDEATDQRALAGTRRPGDAYDPVAPAHAVKGLQQGDDLGIVSLDARDQARRRTDVAGNHGIEQTAIGFLHVPSPRPV